MKACTHSVTHNQKQSQAQRARAVPWKSHLHIWRLVPELRRSEAGPLTQAWAQSQQRAQEVEKRPREQLGIQNDREREETPKRFLLFLDHWAYTLWLAEERVLLKDEAAPESSCWKCQPAGWLRGHPKSDQKKNKKTKKQSNTELLHFFLWGKFPANLLRSQNLKSGRNWHVHTCTHMHIHVLTHAYT